ncbi:MAG: ROK family protein [Bacteroidales bacterium]|nr:ROK family protein [Bacteroidales bacterium]
MEALGIDFGGSGIKGAIVDTTTGRLLGERHRIPTPQPASPEKVAETIVQLIRYFNYQGPVGCGFPALINNGTAMTASNIDKGWIGVNAEELFSKVSGMPVYVLNDADAAGIGELRFGAGNGARGVALLLTIGTGIGSALLNDGVLLPSTELGHIEFKGDIAERYCSDAVREREGLSWEKWGKRFDKYLVYMEKLFSPSMFIIGGGVSKKMDQFKHCLTVKAPVLPATLRNQAGIIGAACYAADKEKQKSR